MPTHISRAGSARTGLLMDGGASTKHLSIRMIDMRHIEIDVTFCISIPTFKQRLLIRDVVVWSMHCLIFAIVFFSVFFSLGHYIFYSKKYDVVNTV